VPIHEDVLNVARRLCRERGNWRFAPDEVVRALPHLNESSVRTHVVSRCCVNAPRNHPHKWDYFRRLRRGVYEILPAWRGESGGSTAGRVAEPPARYGLVPARDTLHASVSRGEALYVAECWELAVVTQGRTLDEVVTNLREAIVLHLEGERLPALGLAPALRLVVSYESPLPDVPQAPSTLG
jgi:predicted RNase H-like HicB family nuclease